MAAFGFALPAGAQSLPPPELLFVWPDRPAPGDEVELTGRWFTGAGCTVRVGLSWGVEVSPRVAEEETVRFLVPPVAGGVGQVWVTRSCSDVLGAGDVHSNRLPIFVGFREIQVASGEFFARPVATPANTPGVLLAWGSSSGQLTVARLMPDGSVSGQQTFAQWGLWRSLTCWWDLQCYGVGVLDRDYQVAGAIHLNSGVPIYALSGQSWEKWHCLAYPLLHASWCPLTVTLTEKGHLMVAAAQALTSYPQWVEVGIWELEPGHTLVPDLGAPNCLTPGGIRRFKSYSVGGCVYWARGDSTAGGSSFFHEQFMHYYPCDVCCAYGKPSEVWAVDSSRALTIFSLPFGPPEDPCLPNEYHRSSWLIAADCRGNLFGLTNGCTRPLDTTVIRRFPSGQAVAAVNHGAEWHPISLNSDTWGNLYVSLQKCVSLGDTYSCAIKVRRVMPEDFLDTAYCTLEDEGGTSPPGGSSQVCSSCQRGKKVLVKVYKDPDLEEKEKPENIVLLDGPRELSLAHGLSPEFEAYVCSVGEKLPCGQKVRAHFELSQLAVEAGVDAERAIYPNHPVFWFGPDLAQVEGDRARMQTVHWGRAKLTVSVPGNGEEEVQPLTVDVKVVKPSTLGLQHKKYDSLITEVAHRYGIPPQVVKAHVRHEAELTEDPPGSGNLEFNATAFRYEPRTVDKELFWKRGKLADSRYRPFSVPDGRCLWPEDVAPRSKYSRLTITDALPLGWQCSQVPAECQDHPTLFNYVEANDGWVPCSPPWKVVNDTSGCPENPGKEIQTGPCHRRERWWARTEAGNMSYSPFDGRFYCGRYIVVDCTDSKEAKWLLNDGNNWIGQTALASSYGLMQLLYTTAVDTGWRAGEDACNRHPFLLFNPEDNLNAGVGYVTTLLVEKVLKARELVLKEQGLWVGFLKQALGYYNAGRYAGRPNLDYANAVWDRVALYQPGF